MMNMDWQRTAYLSGIFVLGFLLLFEWNKFNDLQTLEANKQKNAATITVPENNRQDYQTVVTDNTVNGAVSNTVIRSNEDSELPTASNNSEITLPKEVATISNNNRLIQVKTDNFDLHIDKLGGDIIKVALLNHKLRLGEEEPYILLNNTENSTYIAKSGIIGNNATDTAKGRPVFNSEANEYQLKEGEKSLKVVLNYQQGDVTIRKIVGFTRGDYLISVNYEIDNQSSEVWQGQLYGQIRRDSRKPIATADLGFGVNPYLGAATTDDDDKYIKVSFDDIEDKSRDFSVNGGWIAMIQHYFIGAWIPNKDNNNYFKLQKLKNQDIYLLTFRAPNTRIEPGQTGILSADFYAGPKNIKRLEEISPYLDLTIDFGWLWWIAKPLLQLLLFINGFIGNWGWSIIALTFVIKAVFFYPSAVSYRSMARMRTLAPKLQRLKDLYGDDRQKMSQEMMKIYKTEKVNPMGGCLPILIQMPVFIALYWVLMESVELRHAPFMLWINDLSVKDPYFIFPLLMGATMFIQQQLNPTPPDPMQAKIMKWMPVAFTFMFLWFPAGLVIYWVTNNTLSIIQQYIITRKIEAESKS